MRIKFLFVIPFLPLLGISQKNIEEKNSIDIINEGIEAYRKEKYADAIDLYGKVSLNDTNYTLAQFEIADSYFALLEYGKAQSTLEELLKLNLLYEYNNDIYNKLGVAYSEDKKLDKAVLTLTEGIIKYPKSYLLYYNRALVHMKLKKHKEAIEDYKMAISCKAGHASSHYQLGLYAMHEGKYSEASLSFITFLLLETKTQRANEVLILLENMSNGEVEEVSKSFVWEEKDNFDDHNVLFKNKVALEKAYKVKLSIECAYGKQLHFLLENLKYNKENTGFWNQTYLPLLQQIVKDEKFDDLILFSLQSSGSDKVKSKLDAKRSKLTDFLSYAKVQWADFASRKYVAYEGVVQHVYVDYSNTGLASLGLVNDAKLPVGKWTFYHNNGSKKMTGTFSSEGKRTGKWTVYNLYNGKISSTINYLNGKIDGEVNNFYLYGELKDKKFFKDDKLDDTVFMYFRSGDLFRKYAVSNDLMNGAYVEYHENGQISSSYSNKDAVPNGPYRAYHPNGKIALDFNLVNNEIDGLYAKYYPNGQKQILVNYKLGNRDGLYQTWYSNGSISEISNYKDGNQVGEFKDYLLNGVISYSGVLDESGKQNGFAVNNDFDGKKYIEREFKKGELITLMCFNKKGEQIYKSSKRGKKLDYKVYYPDGTLKAEGLYENDEREGEWKFYDEYSNLSGIENYEKGQIVDTVTYYYANGQVKEKTVYDQGVLNGLSLHYNIFGELTREGLYLNGEADKDWYGYFDNGVLSYENYYVDADQHGVQVSYDVNGKLDTYKEYEYGRVISQNFADTSGTIIDKYGEFHGVVKLHDACNSFIRYEANYKNGMSDGVSKYIGPNNHVETIGSFVNGQKEGEWLSYFSNKVLSNKKIYVNDELDGISKRYNKEGVLVENTTYVNGELNGQDTDYHPNGKKSVETMYLDGKKHGKATYYDEEGSVVMFRYFDYGVFRSYSYLGADGKEVAPIFLGPGNNLIVTYFQNGKKATEHNRKNGLIEGVYYDYYSNGQVASEKTFKFGEYHGKSKEYYPSGKLKAETDYEFGNNHGKALKYYEDGTLMSSSMFVLGDLHGEFLEYSKEGKLIKTTVYYGDETIRSTEHK